MENIIIVIVLLLIVGGIILYLWKAKKRGEKCIGCPYGKRCANKGNCSCKSKTDKNK